MLMPLISVMTEDISEEDNVYGPMRSAYLQCTTWFLMLTVIGFIQDYGFGDIKILCENTIVQVRNIVFPSK